MSSTPIDWNLINLDTYEKQANFLNSLTAFGKPVMRVTPEYLAMEDEKSGFQSKKLEDMIPLTETGLSNTEATTTLYVPLQFGTLIKNNLNLKNS